MEKTIEKIFEILHMDLDDALNLTIIFVIFGIPLSICGIVAIIEILVG